MAQQGKSFLLELLILQELLQYQAQGIAHKINWWLFDPRHQHGWYPPDRHPPGWNPLTVDAKIINRAEDLAEGRYILQPESNIRENFLKFCEASRQIWNLVLIIEEVQLFVGKMSLPDFMLDLITSGCNHGNTYIALTQRPAEVHNAILSNAHHRYVFRLQIPSDVETVGKWLGSKEDAEWIRTSPKHAYLYHHYLDPKPERCSPA